jgi:hypothetical protein
MRLQTNKTCAPLPLGSRSRKLQRSPSRGHTVSVPAIYRMRSLTDIITEQVRVRASMLVCLRVCSSVAVPIGLTPAAQHARLSAHALRPCLDLNLSYFLTTPSTSPPALSLTLIRDGPISNEAGPERAAHGPVRGGEHQRHEAWQGWQVLLL